MNKTMVKGTHLRCERDDRVLFNDFSFSLQQGSLVQLRGENGAGKTTFLRALLKLNDLMDGEVNWSEPWGNKSYFNGDRLIYIGHKSGMSAYLTAEENLEFQLKLKGLSSTEYDIYTALETVGLRGFEDSLVQQMSAGQQRRVALAQLWLPQVEQAIWVLDEPFTALDVNACEQLERRMMAFAHTGGTVLFTSHQNPKHFTPSILEIGGKIV